MISRKQILLAVAPAALPIVRRPSATVTVDASNNIYVGGRTQEAATIYVWAIMKFAPTGGTALWRSNVGTAGDSRPRAIAINAAGTQIAVVGTRAGQAGSLWRTRTS